MELLQQQTKHLGLQIQISELSDFNSNINNDLVNTKNNILGYFLKRLSLQCYGIFISVVTVVEFLSGAGKIV